MAEIGFMSVVFFPSKALLGPLLQQGEREQITGSLACLLCKEQGACTLYGVRIEVCSGVRLGGVAQGFCPPLMWQCMQGACTVPCFCSKKWQMGFLVFVALDQIFLNCASSSCLVSYCFFVFCSRRGVQMQALQQSPRFSLSHFHQRDSTPFILKGKRG